MATTVRDCRLRDAEQVARLWKETIDCHARISRADFALVRDAERRWLGYCRRTLRRKNVKMLVAENDGEVIGYLIGDVRERPDVFRTRRFGFINEAGVTERQRGRGVGKMLVSAYLEWARRKKANYVNIFVDVENVTGLGFWKKRGFKTVMVRQTRML